MNFIDELNDKGTLDDGHGRHEWQIELNEERRIARAFRVGDAGHGGRGGLDDPFDAHLPRVAGVALWDDFYALTDVERQQLKLGEGRWIIAMRSYIQGTMLAEIPDRARGRWRQWGLELARILRGLHAQRWCHGAVHPGNIIIDDDERLWLVNLPLLVADKVVADKLNADEMNPGAALMAPELWQGDQRRSASDVYSASVLICWMIAGGQYPLHADDPIDWPRIHRDVAPELPFGIDGRLSGALKRGLAKLPDTRPTIQLLIEALLAAGDEAAPAYVALPTSLYRGLERNVVDQLGDQTRAISLVGDRGTGKSFALERIYSRYCLCGRRAVYLAPSFVRGPGPGQSRKTVVGGDPWEPLRQLILAIDEDCELSQLGDVTGDGLHVFSTWSERLQNALPQGQTVVLWDEFEAAGPDIRAFWTYYLRTTAGSEQELDGRIGFVTATSVDWEGAAEQIPVVGPGERGWNGWRGRTLLSEVHDIDSERWAELVEEYGKQPVCFFEAINKELGSMSAPELAVRKPAARAMRDVSVIFAGDWRRHLAGLFRSGAYTQAVETCRRLYEVLARSSREETVDILRIWVEAVIRLSVDGVEADLLASALADADSSTRRGVDAILMLARLRWEQRRPAEGLELLDGLEALENGGEVEHQRWRAQIVFSMGDYDEAHRIAQVGLSLIEDLPGSFHQAHCHLSVIAAGARAVTGDAEAIDTLQWLSASLDEAVTPRIRSQCHAYRAVGLGRRSQLEESIDACLRALEELELAGLAGKLPSSLLRAGTAYHRQGRLGLAREYYARGRRLAEAALVNASQLGATADSATRARLLAREADIDIALGRIAEAWPLLEEAVSVGEEFGLRSIVVTCHGLAGEIEYLEDRPERAIEIYKKALTDDNVHQEQRARLLLSSAEASMRVGLADEAAGSIDQARRLIDEYDLNELESLHGILRARLQWTERGTLGPMAGLEMFRRHLETAGERGDHKLVLRQSIHLWRRLHIEGLVDLMREVAQIVQRSKNAVAIGLTRELREQFYASLPAIPHPDDIDLEELSQPGIESEVEALRSESERLVDEVASLRGQLVDKDEQIDKLEMQLQEVRDRLELEGEERRALESRIGIGDAGNRSQSKRGRKPKATRDDVVAALKRCDYNFEVTASELGVSKRTLYRYVNKYAIEA